MGVFDRLSELAGGDDATQDEPAGAGGADDAGDGPEANGPPTAANPATMDPVDYRDRAEALADRSNVPTLDFTVASLGSLDTMAEGPTIPVEDPVAIGSYLGETLLRAYDGWWVRDDGPAVAVDLGADETTVAVFDAATMALEQGPVFQDVAARLEAEGATPIDGVPPAHPEVEASAAATSTPAGTDRSDDGSDDAEDDSDDAEDGPDDPADEPDQLEDELDAVEGESDDEDDDRDESKSDDADGSDEPDEAADGVEEAPDDSGDDRDDALEPETTDDAEPVHADELAIDEDHDVAVADDKPVPVVTKADDHERTDAEVAEDANVTADRSEDADGAETGADAEDAVTEESVDDGTDDEQGVQPVDDVETPASTAAGVDVVEPAIGADRADDIDVAGPDEGPTGEVEASADQELSGEEEASADQELSGEEEASADQELSGEEEASGSEEAPGDHETPVGSGSDPGEDPPVGDSNEPATVHDADDPEGPAATAPAEDDSTEPTDEDPDDEVSADDGGPETAEDGPDDATSAAADVDPALDVTVDEIELDEADEPGSPVDPGSLPGTRAATDDDGATAADAADGPTEDDVADGDATDGDSLGVAADIVDLTTSGGDADAADAADVDAGSDESSTAESPADAGESPTSPTSVGSSEGIDTDEDGPAADEPGGGAYEARGGVEENGTATDEPTPADPGPLPSRVAGDASPSTPFADAARDDGTLEDLAAELSGTSLPPRPELKRASREFADTWPDREFDVSPASLARLDAFLDGQWDGRFEPGSLADELSHPRDGLRPLARVGAYAGQVLVENLDGEWVPTEDGEGAVEVEGRGDTVEEVPVFDVARSCMTGESTLAYQFDALANRVGSEASAREVDDVFDVRDRRADSTAVIPAILDRAEAFTERWPSAGLDYAPASLGRLDDLVDEEFDVADRSGVHVGESMDPDSLLLTERVTSAAAYYATVCVNHLDANWRIDDEVALLVEGSAGSRAVDPVSVAAGAIRGEDTFAGHFERLAERIGCESAVPE